MSEWRQRQDGGWDFRLPMHNYRGYPIYTFRTGWHAAENDAELRDLRGQQIAWARAAKVALLTHLRKMGSFAARVVPTFQAVEARKFGIAPPGRMLAQGTVKIAFLSSAWTGRQA